MNLPLLLAFAAGVVSFVSPCIVPMISVYLTLITGLSVAELTESGAPPRRVLLWDTALFALGFGLVFTLAGAASGAIAASLTRASRPLEIFGGVVVILLGLSLAGLFNVHWLHRVRVPLARPTKRPRGPFGSFLVGLFFAVACSHCIAPTLYSILLVAGATGSAQGGMLVMLLFSVGLALPFLVTAVAITPVLGRLRRSPGRIRVAQQATGMLLAGFGLLMLLGQFTRLVGLTSALLPRGPVGM